MAHYKRRHFIVSYTKHFFSNHPAKYVKSHSTAEPQHVARRSVVTAYSSVWIGMAIYCGNQDFRFIEKRISIVGQ